MAVKNTVVFGIFSNRAVAESAVNQLTFSGFSTRDISVLMSNSNISGNLPTEKHTKSPESATTGVSGGGATGGNLGLLAGLRVLAIPGVGPLFAAGPLVATLTGLGAGGAAGGLIGAFAGLGLPDYEARRYEGRMQNGGILVSVHCDTGQQATLASELLRTAGGEDVASTYERRGNGRTTNDENDLVGAARSKSITSHQIPVEEIDRQPATTGEASTSRTTYY